MDRTPAEPVSTLPQKSPASLLADAGVDAPCPEPDLSAVEKAELSAFLGLEKKRDCLIALKAVLSSQSTPSISEVSKVGHDGR